MKVTLTGQLKQNVFKFVNLPAFTAWFLDWKHQMWSMSYLIENTLVLGVITHILIQFNPTQKYLINLFFVIYSLINFIIIKLI